MPNSGREGWAAEQLPYVCVVCGSGYAEYINGCPHCWDAGLRSKVTLREDAPKFNGQPTEVIDERR